MIVGDALVVKRKRNKMIYKIINAIVDRNNKLKELTDDEEISFVKSQIEYLDKLLNGYLKSD